MQRIPGRALRALFAPLLRRLRQRPHEPLASYDAPRTLDQTKRATDEMNRRLATVAKRTTNGVVTTDAKRRITWVNDGFTRMSGYTLAESVGKSPGELLQNKNTDPRTVAKLRAAFNANVGLRCEVLNQAKDGREYWLDIDVQPEFADDGSLLGFISIESDITEQVRTREQLRSVFSAVAEGIVHLDAAGEIIDCNRAAERILGLTAAQISGRTAKDPRWRAIREDGTDFPGEEHPTSITLRTGESIRHCMLGIHLPDGSLRWLSVSSEPMRDVDGRVISVVASFADVTTEKASATRLIDAERQALAASAAKSEFLANMSHEIRTPMTAMLGYTDLLGEDGFVNQTPALRAEYVGTIKRNGEHLLAIINDILDISKIEAGKMSAERMAVSPAQLMHEVESLMALRAHAKGITLETHADTALPATIQTDPMRLRQVLMNLIGNAIKFTELGGVQVRASLDEATAGGPFLRIAVVDTGIGLEPAQLGKLFEAFSQSDDSITRKFGGTGLGLRIAKSLAALMGGDIAVASEVGVGSTFTLMISTGPLDGIPRLDAESLLEDFKRSSAPERADSTNAGAEQPLAGHRIFFAEDGPDNQRLIGYHLRKAGATVQVFDNGLLLLEAMTRDGTIHGPLHQIPRCDVVLTDMQMPVMDGYALATTLRSKGWTQRIVAITAHVMAGDAEKCQAAGCDRVGSKPINRMELIELCTVAGARREIPGLEPALTPDDVLTSLDGEELHSEWEAFDDLADLASSFAAGLAGKADDFERILAGRDQPTLKVALHQLKGSAGGYGYPTITEAAGKAELLVSLGQDWTHIGNAVERLCLLCRRAARSAAIR
jgi:PAS domain S-box-containing protein